jgi:hypothetical protein
LSVTGTGTTTCGGGAVSVVASGTSIALTGAVIPAAGSCTVTVGVSSNASGTYTNPIAAGALTSAQGGTGTAAATAPLTVTAPSHGGGAIDWVDLTFIAGVLLVGRRRMLLWSLGSRRG